MEVVTGSTDGIGKSYAKELAKRGYNVVLVARNQEKLDAVANEIREQANTEVRTVQFDFTAGDVTAYERIRTALNGLSIGVLVNNVGVSIDCPDEMHQIPEQRSRDIVTVNDLSVTMMSQMLIGQMLERKQGAVINISSASACIPTGLLAVYSASKAFVDFLSRAMQWEYANSGVFIQSVLPYFVATNMSKVRRSSFFIPFPDAYARSALNTVGITYRTHGCLSHAIQGFLHRLIPEFVLGKRMVNFLKDVRTRAQKKAAAAKNE